MNLVCEDFSKAFVNGHLANEYPYDYQLMS